jgi:hypothetical protein
VSAAIAAVFSAHGQQFQALSAQAAAFHNQFVQLMNAGAGQYALTEAANATPLQTVGHDLLNAVNAPTQALLGRPLIGNGANGAPGTGQAGGPGGILIAEASTRGVVRPGFSAAADALACCDQTLARVPAAKEVENRQ